MSKRYLLIAAALLSGTALAAPGPKFFQTFLSGYEEVPPISTSGNGWFSARISNDEQTVHWELSYADLVGDVTQAHIHFGQRGVNGGIIVFLCTNLGNAPMGSDVPPCPPAPGTVTGSFTATDIIGPSDRGIEPGALADALRAIRADVTYVNVHSTQWGPGEVRGQLTPGRGEPAQGRGR